MFFKSLLTGLFSLLLSSCAGQSASHELQPIESVRIHRFDQALFQMLEQPESRLEEEMRQQYPEMLEILGKGVLNLRSLEAEGFFRKLRGYYAEPTLHQLYADALRLYADVSDMEQGLQQTFSYLKSELPDLQVPAVYMHVSGLNQNVLVGDSLLSLSIDKYLGEDYPLYQEYFYQPQRRRMTPLHVVPDYLIGWLMASYPFEGNERVLLDRMIYEGKVRYAVGQALKALDSRPYRIFSLENERWCEQHEAEMWQRIIERKQLYTPDQMVTDSFFDDLVSPFPETDAPWNVGTWIGYRIVQRYVERTHSTLSQLMQTTDAQTILSEAKYKP